MPFVIRFVQHLKIERSFFFFVPHLCGTMSRLREGRSLSSGEGRATMEVSKMMLIVSNPPRSFLATLPQAAASGRVGQIPKLFFPRFLGHGARPLSRSRCPFE